MWDLLWVLYLPAKQCVSSISAHSLCVSVSHFRLLKWETPTFISSGLWLQHQDLNPLIYKICIKLQQRVLLRKIHNVNRLTLWYGWHAVEQRIIDNVSGVNVSKCVSVLCPCSRTIFLLFSLTAHCTFVHFNVLVWWKLQVSRCYCVEYIRFSPFLIFYISQGSAAT